MHENTFFIPDINCICHALQFDTIQAMLQSVIQYDLLLLLCLLWPWPLTYIDIFWLGYGARNLAIYIYSHKLVFIYPKSFVNRCFHCNGYNIAYIAKMTFDLISKWPWHWISIFSSCDGLQMSCSSIWYHAWHISEYFSIWPIFSTLTYFDLDLWPT